MNWQTYTGAQVRALARVAQWKSAPQRLIVGEDDDHNLIVVPPSYYDRRRWDISRGGAIRKKER